MIDNLILVIALGVSGLATLIILIRAALGVFRLSRPEVENEAEV